MIRQTAYTFAQVQRQARLAQLSAQVGDHSTHLLGKAIDRLPQTSDTTDSACRVRHNIRDGFQGAIQGFAQF